MAWTSMSTQTAEAVITTTEWNKIPSNMAEVGDAWTSFTPTIGGTGWVLGDGDVTGSAYRLMGKWLRGRCSLVYGSTSTAGAGQLTFTLPTGTAVTAPQAVTVTVIDDSTGTVVNAAGYVASGGTTIETNVDSAFLTWATSDVVTVEFSLEIA